MKLRSRSWKYRWLLFKRKHNRISEEKFNLEDQKFVEKSKKDFEKWEREYKEKNLNRDIDYIKVHDVELLKLENKTDNNSLRLYELNLRLKGNLMQMLIDSYCGFEHKKHITSEWKN